jgi:hypothetical protein
LFALEQQISSIYRASASVAYRRRLHARPGIDLQLHRGTAYRKGKIALGRPLNGRVCGTNADRLDCVELKRRFVMRAFLLLGALALGLLPTNVLAELTDWRSFVIPSTGTSVEFPVTIFSKQAELPDGGTGRRFYTVDRRANLTVQSVANPENDSPAAFLAKKQPPAGIVYTKG